MAISIENYCKTMKFSAVRNVVLAQKKVLNEANNMSKEEHRLGVSEVNRVVRHLKLEPIELSKVQAAIAENDLLYGLDGNSFDEKSHVLNLTYDAFRLCLDGIEDVLTKCEVEVSHNWWTDFKEGYYKFVDENVKGNVGHQPWSCHSRLFNVSSYKKHQEWFDETEKFRIFTSEAEPEW